MAIDKWIEYSETDHLSLPISICIFASITSYPLPASPSELDRRSPRYSSLCCTYNVCKFASKRPTLISHSCVRTHLSAFSPLSLFSRIKGHGRALFSSHAFSSYVCMRKNILLGRQKGQLG
ncbi:hypothetical protein E4T42_05570 [Aureobasidium subglaciale]|nr:hypothetical protein E4T42_05570 [Aureobasidium subglaciale]